MGRRGGRRPGADPGQGYSGLGWGAWGMGAHPAPAPPRRGGLSVWGEDWGTWGLGGRGVPRGDRVASWPVGVGGLGGPREPPGGGAAGQNCALAQPASWREATATGQAAPGPAARMARHPGCGARGPLVEPREGRGRKGEEGGGRPREGGKRGGGGVHTRAGTGTGSHILYTKTAYMGHDARTGRRGGGWLVAGTPFRPAVCAACHARRRRRGPAPSPTGVGFPPVVPWSFWPSGPCTPVLADERRWLLG